MGNGIYKQTLSINMLMCKQVNMQKEYVNEICRYKTIL